MASGAGYQLMRVHCMLDLVDVASSTSAPAKPADAGSATPTYAYNFTLLDGAFDAIVQIAGLTPVVNLDGNPTGVLHALFLENDFLNDQKVVQWRDLIEALGSHLVQRYGANETSTWFFEHWNEPMTIDKFCADGEETRAFGSFQSMFNYYDACENGLARADPGLVIGGPTTHSGVVAGSKGDPVGPFLAHCDNGTNYFKRGEPAEANTGTRLDFISIHRKGTYNNNNNKGGDGGGGGSNSSNILAAERGYFELIREQHPKFQSLPFFNDEADPVSGWSKELGWRPTPIYAAYMVAVVADHVRAFDPPAVQLPSEPTAAVTASRRIDGVPFAVLSNDNSFTAEMAADDKMEAAQPGGWLIRTLIATFTKSTRLGSSSSNSSSTDTGARVGGDDSFVYSVIKKPDLTVMSLLTKLGNTQLPISISSGGGRAMLSGIASRSNNCATTIVFRSNDASPVEQGGVNTTLRIAIDTSSSNSNLGTNLTVAHWQLDAVNGNPYAAWVAAGSPAWPSEALMAAMERAQEPVLMHLGPATATMPAKHGSGGSGGGVSIPLQLPLPSVAAVQVCGQKGLAPQAPAPAHPSLLLLRQGGGVAIHWRASDEARELVQTYVVECSTAGVAGEFARVNPSPLIATTFVHRCSASQQPAAKRCYRVRTVDLWGATSAASNAGCLLACGNT